MAAATVMRSILQLAGDGSSPSLRSKWGGELLNGDRASWEGKTDVILGSASAAAVTSFSEPLGT